MKLLLLLLSACTPSQLVAAEPDDAKLAFPIIAGFGGVVPLPNAAEQPRKGSKVLFDISAEAKSTEANKGLVRVARLLNLYGASGMKASDVKVALVLHGEATKSALNEGAFKAKFGGLENPNLPLIRSLRKAGVEVFVCGQAWNAKGYSEGELSKEVTPAAAALSVVINRQVDGFAVIQIP